MSIIVYQDVGTPIVPVEGIAGRIREALGDSLRSMRYPTPDFAGMYQDAAGTTPVTAVGQPVGLMLDRRFGLERGPELIPQPVDLTSNWETLGEGVITGSNTFTTTSSSGSGVVFRDVIVAGRTYEVSSNISSTGAGNVSIRLGTTAANVIPQAPSTPKAVVTAAASGLVYIRASGADEVTIHSLSIREIPGNHASQPTTTARPTLRSGPLRIDYDGVDDFLRTTFPSALGSNVTIARSIPGEGAQIITGQTVGTEWDDDVTSCATLVIDRALTGSETALVTAFLNQQAGV